jgi:hypothetical protein
LALGTGPVNVPEAKDLKRAISANFPGAFVQVTPLPAGGEIYVQIPGEKGHRYETTDDYLTSPIVRLLVGEVIR